MADLIKGHLQTKDTIVDLVDSVYNLSTSDGFDESSRDIVRRFKDLLGTIPRDSKKITMEHLQIVEPDCLPESLVSLFNSPITSYKEMAEESIRLFLYPAICPLPRIIQNHCASIVSWIARYLGLHNGPDHPLYISCRETIVYLLKSMGFANRSRYFGGMDEESMIENFFLFSSDIENNLIENLYSMSQSSSLTSCLKLSFESNLREYAVFSLHLRRAIEDLFRLKGQSLPLCVDDKFRSHPCFVLGIECYYKSTFNPMLAVIIECLSSMWKRIRRAEGVLEFNPGWSYYLDVLKELNNYSKLCQGAEEKLSSVLRKFQFPLEILVAHSKRSDDHQWLLKHKNVIGFESRRRLIVYMFPEVEVDDEKLHNMLIDRSQLLTQSFEHIARADPRLLRNGVSMEFKDEIATGHGVLREWLFLVCQALFSSQKSLFLACPYDRRRLYPNPMKVDPHHLDYFRFCGQVIALALMHEVQVGIAFDRVFFLQLAGEGICLEDMRDTDPCLYKSCKKILEMDADFVDSDAMGMTFVNETEELGSRKVVELCPGGSTIIVNSKNREEYVHLLIQHRFVKSVAKQVAYFARGFGDILRKQRLQKIFFQSVEHNDLDLMLLGSDKAICVKDWREHTYYDDYNETDDQICWFWKVVEGMSSEQRRELLFFWTSVKYLPINGFAGLRSRLYIYKKTSGSHYHLPSSHTCFYRLSLPPYPSLADMQQHLFLICEEHVGSTFGLT